MAARRADGSCCVGCVVVVVVGGLALVEVSLALLRLRAVSSR